MPRQRRSPSYPSGVGVPPIESSCSARTGARWVAEAAGCCVPVIAQSHSGCASRVREGRLWHDATYVAVCHGRGPSASAASRRAPGSISAMRDRCTTLAGQMRVHAGARRSTATKNDCMRAIVDRWRQEAKHKNRACGDDDVRLLSRRSRDGHRPEAGAHRGTAIRKRAP